MTRATSLALREGLRMGLIMAVVTLFIVLTGMVVSFESRELLGFGTLGTLILVILGIAPGLVATTSLRKRAHLQELTIPAGLLLMTGLIVGLIVGVALALLAFLLQHVNLREILVNATPELYDTLTRGQDLIVAMPLLAVSGAILGLLGAASRMVPRQVQQAIVLLATVWILASLLPLEFLAFVALMGLLGWVTRRYGGQIQGGLAARSSSGRNRRLLWLILLAGGWVLMLGVGPAILGDYWARVLGFVGLYAMLGLGLNIVVGFAGLLDLGYVAFFAIGAYTMALLSSPSSTFGTELNFWVVLPISMLMAAVAGVLLGIPVLRMRGDYLAIVTLGFGEIIRILLLSDLLKPVTGGPQGVLGTPSPRLAGLEFIKPLHFYYLVVLGCLVVGFVSTRLSYARVGRAWIAMREDEDVAQAMGINLVYYKLLAFATGAAFAGISGAIFASWQHAIFPADFTLFVSINVLVLIIIGGIGSIPGVVLGAAVLVGLPEVLREVEDYRILAYGALLVLMMIVRPEGLWPSQRRKLEMHESEELTPEVATAPSTQ